MNFSQAHSGTEVQLVSCACFPKEKHQNSQNWAKFMNFSSFWPFFGLVCWGRLLNEEHVSSSEVIQEPLALKQTSPSERPAVSLEPSPGWRTPEKQGEACFSKSTFLRFAKTTDFLLKPSVFTGRGS